MRKARNSNLAFGGELGHMLLYLLCYTKCLLYVLGCLLICTMDHTQLGAVEGWPFLLSTHILTDFVLVKLGHSVRAHADPQLQKLQSITRMNPFVLRESEELKTEFVQACECLTFVDDWTSSEITSETQCMFPTKKPKREASEQFINACKRDFASNNIHYITNDSKDLQRLLGSRGEFHPAISEDVIEGLNSAMKEPQTLLFWRGGLYEATVNTNQFNQSQILLLLDVPTRQQLDNKESIVMYAAPAGIPVVVDMENLPTEADLLQTGWKKVRVKHSPARTITRKGVQGQRQQYSLCHIGNSTIHKLQGATIVGKVAVEVSGNSAPWMKQQV